MSIFVVSLIYPDEFGQYLTISQKISFRILKGSGPLSLYGAQRQKMVKV
jgi:hypothetical protein